MGMAIRRSLFLGGPHDIRVHLRGSVIRFCFMTGLSVSKIGLKFWTTFYQRGLVIFSSSTPYP